MNWDSPSERLSLMERVGIEEYNRQFSEYLAANPIRPVSSRFGTLYSVTGTDQAFPTSEEAERFLREQRDVR